MSIPDLELTARLVGLPLPELWSEYVAVGGSLPLTALTDRVAGNVSWSPREELYLAVALNDVLIDESLVSLDPLDGLLEDQRPGWRSDLRDRPGRERSGPPLGVVPHALTADLDALIERCRETRSAARRLRGSAQAAQRRAAESATDQSVVPARAEGAGTGPAAAAGRRTPAGGRAAGRRAGAVAD